MLLVGNGSGDSKTATSYYMNGVTFSVSLTAGKRYAVNVSVNNTNIGVQYFTAPSAKTRPSNWYWSGISSGAAISVSASTWNQFCSRINEFRKYKGLFDFSFTPAVSGQPMYASQANQAWNAINGISGHGSMPNSVWTGAEMSASFMIDLQNALNSIS